MPQHAPAERELAETQRLATEVAAAQRELAAVRELHANRDDEYERELFELRAEIEHLTRELADCQGRQAGYQRLYEQSRQQVASLRQQNLTCLAAIEMLRRGHKGHQQLLAAYQRHLNQSVGDEHHAATAET